MSPTHPNWGATPDRTRNRMMARRSRADKVEDGRKATARKAGSPLFLITAKAGQGPPAELLSYPSGDCKTLPRRLSADNGRSRDLCRTVEVRPLEPSLGR